MNKIVIKSNIAVIILHSKGIEYETIIDVEDVAKVKQYHWIKSGRYVMSRTYGNTEYLHRLIMQPSKNYVIDHINGDGLDNRKNNLRICKQQNNTQHNLKLRDKNTTGVVGVRLYKPNGKYIARIVVNGKTVHLGYFANIDDAIDARLKAEKKYFGEYAGINKNLF